VCHIARVDVAEVARGHGEGDATPLPAERQRRAHVVHRLGAQPAPVDRVECGEVQALAERGVIEQRLQERLAVVERALDRDVVHVLGRDRGHLAALYLGDAPARMQNHDLHARAPGARRDRCRAGVARGRPDDRDRALAPRQEMLEQQPQQLERDVLERKRRPVEQLEQPLVRPELAQRRDGDMVEAGIRPRDQHAQLALVKIVADERRQDPRGDLLVRGALQRGELVPLQARPALGQIQPAVAGQPGEQRLLEATRLNPAARADVAQAQGPPERTPPSLGELAHDGKRQPDCADVTGSVTVRLTAKYSCSQDGLRVQIRSG
jgi:hypothetical protein